MKLFNHIISIVLLLTFVFNIMGYDVVFRITHYQIKKEVKRKLKAEVPQEKLHTIVIPKAWWGKSNRFFKTIHSREFEYKGQMYDVVTKTEKNNFIYFKCIKDIEETMLFVNLEEHINNYISAFPQTKNKNKKLYTKITKDYFSSHHLLHFNIGEINYKYKIFSQPNCLTQYFSVDFPPPQI